MMVYAEVLYLCKNKLGYTYREARHIYIGKYREQFEIYKKYHNMEMKKLLFVENSEETDKQTSDNQEPAWYTKYMKDKQKGASNGK